ncbi:MAG: hypothetical protein ABI400_05950 [Lacisediminihabitans sp.]
MDSEEGEVSTSDAAAWLRNHDQIQDLVNRRVPTRSQATLSLWGALVLAVYVGVFLIAFGGRTVHETVSNGGDYQFSNMLLVPLLAFSFLVNGARERMGIQRKPAGRSWILYLAIFVAFMALGVLSLVGVGYPWWLNLLVPLLLFVTLAITPLRQLRQSVKTPETERWVTKPLSRPTRWTTAVIGVTFGLLVATSTSRWFPILSIIAFMLILGALIGLRTRWGLPRTGYEWGPWQWVAFGLATGVLFLDVALLTFTPWMTTAVAIIAGVLVAAVMVLAALFPRAADR